MNISSTNGNKNFKHDESDVSIEIQPINVLTSFVSPTKKQSIKHTRQEPLIMQTVHSQKRYNFLFMHS